MNDKLENAYVNIENFVLEHCSTDEWNEFAEYIQLVQKAVKAIQIIEKKNVCTDVIIKGISLKEYNKRVLNKEWKLTPQEFDLLKEVLSCEAI